MRGKLLLLLAAAAFTVPALAADPPYKKVTLPVSPRPRPALKDDVRPAPDIPLDLSKAVPSKALGNLPSSAAQLGTLKAEMAQEKPAVDSAKEKSDQLSAEAKSLRQKLIATAARIENLEQETITLGDEIERLEKQNAELTAGFERDRISVTRLLAILERLQHDMPPALAVRPDDALGGGAGRHAGGRQPAAGLCRSRQACPPHRCAESHPRSPWSSAAPKPPPPPRQLTTARADLETLTAQKEAEAEAAGGEYGTLKSKMAEIAAKAADFQALVNRVAALRRAGGGDDGITIVTAANTGSLGPLSKGSLLQPVVGTIASASATPRKTTGIRALPMPPAPAPR